MLRDVPFTSLTQVEVLAFSWILNFIRALTFLQTATSPFSYDEQVLHGEYTALQARLADVPVSLLGHADLQLLHLLPQLG
jgi:hypothetical protein